MHVTRGDKVKGFVPPEYDEWKWHYVDGGLPGWEPWQVGVRVQRMPDGELAITGLRIEPFDDFDGRLRDQQLTAAQLRTLPLRLLLSVAARNEAFQEGDMDAFANHVLEGLGIVQAEADSARESDRAQVVGERQARLERVAALYLRVQGRPEVSGPRKFIAESLGVSVGTVDRLLREARTKGILPPYDGAQGKHGKEKAGG